MARIDSFLRLAAEQKASDLHFTSGSTPIVRHDGQLVPVPFRTLSEHETTRFLEEMLIPQEIEALHRHEELDFIYDLKGVARFRVNVFRHSLGLGAVFRIIPNTIPTLDELKLPAALREFAQYQNGLVLICGPTGSGKTTTLAAIVQEMNRTLRRHIITIEDPVEYVHPSLQSLVTQRQVGTHASSFAAALRSALREAPDVIVVGEMRDEETIGLALSAAQTGVLVFGTLHTNSSARAIHRIIDAFPEDSQAQVRGLVSVLLRAVVVQHLVRRSSGEGRFAIVEVLLRTTAVGHMIRDNKLHQLDAYLKLPENEKTGMISLDRSIERLIREGLIPLEDGLRIASDRGVIERIAKQIEEES